MKITKIECTPVLEKFRTPFTMRGDTKIGEPGLITKIYTDEGIVGISDSGGTSSWYRGETIESIMGMIKHYFAPILLGEDPFNIEKIIGQFDFVARDNTQAKAVIDYALHDIKGKALVFLFISSSAVNAVRKYLWHSFFPQLLPKSLSIWPAKHMPTVL
jgi:L-alanine-DL-glutamate epimerase-like enolase superfamily enzyme